MDDKKRINFSIRDPSPCKDCPERFRACSDRCPKDARGEFGYKAWKSEVQRVSLERNRYADKLLDDTKRRERWSIRK